MKRGNLEIPLFALGCFGEAVVDFDFGYVGSFPTIEDGRSNQITLIDSSLRWADGESGIQYLKVEAPQDRIARITSTFFYEEGTKSLSRSIAGNLNWHSLNHC